MTTITLTLTITEEERARLVNRFIETATAVTGEIDGEEGGIPSDPNGSKVDSTGVVWDARFHGANMTKNQDGTWRRKKNLTAQEKADADAYEVGCRGNVAPIAQAAAGVPVAAPVAAPAADVPSFLQTGTFTPQMPVPGMPGIPAAPPAPAPVSYPDLIAAFQAAAARVGEARLNAEIAGIYQRSGVTEMTQLETNENIRIAVKAELDKLV